MKVQTVMSILSLTSMAQSPIVLASHFESSSLQPQRLESTLRAVKAEKYQVANKARYTNEKGEVLEGKIFLKLEHRSFTPANQNQFHAEMVGKYYFESDDYTDEYGGQKYKTQVDLSSADDGETLFDLVHKDKEHSLFKIYGCNSTSTECYPSSSEITLFASGEAQLHLDLDARSGVEVLYRYSYRDENGNLKTEEQYTNNVEGLNLFKVQE
ncbi:MAG: hypothetical protein ACXVLQ_17675 [Bacteriovorax sp.]